MSPEQLSGKEVTVRSDLYALGLLLYEIFTGKKAFTASTVDELIRQQESSTPASISSVAKDVDPLVERVILRCLEKDPDRRPSSAAQVAAALPGGDPLAAAIAAGETPSPEMVAAAPKEGALRPAVAALCLAAVLGALVFLCVASKDVSLLRIVSPNTPPEVLADRAGGIVKRLGYAEPPADAAYDFEIDHDYISHVYEKDASPARLEKFKEKQPAAIRFWYRQSRRHLEPQSDTKVTAADPPPTLPGMIHVVTDTEGRLVSFSAVPARSESQSQSPAVDWAAVFNEAGLKLEDFEPAEPRQLPPVYADSRAAWQGSFPSQPQTPLRIEAASLRGRPVYFELLGEWSAPRPEQEQRSEAERARFFAVIFGVFMTVVVTGALLARRNWRLGRGDPKGAFRLAAIIFALSLLAWAVGASHAFTFFGLVRSFWYAVAWALIQSAIVWLFYMALEPYVRRRTPQRIISWSRLLAGNWRDPLVGRDILIGAAVGLGGSALFFTARELIERRLGRPPYAFPHGMQTLLGAGEIGSILFGRQVFMSLLHGMGYVLILLLLTVLLRKNWLAALGVWALAMLPRVAEGLPSPADFLMSGLTWGLMVFVLARFGLLTMVTVQFFFFMWLFYPYTSDFTAWYAGNTVFALLVCAGTALYGAYTSVGGGAAFKHHLLED